MFNFVNIGYKSGIKDWVLQRFSGLFIFFYVYFFLFYVYLHFNFFDIHFLFNNILFKILTLIFLLNLLIHVNIGFSLVISDYIKKIYIRIFIEYIFNIFMIYYIFFVSIFIWNV